jgi:hypothetical protein
MSPLLLMPLNGLLHHPQMVMNEGECGASSGMLGKGNQITWRKPAAVQLCAAAFLLSPL